jgi:hypothetical protein
VSATLRGATRAAALFVLAAATGCGGGGPDAPEVHRTYDAELEAASESRVEFGRIADLDVDSRGRIYVADAFGHVVVLDAAGRLLRRIGGEGDGPGEFRGLSDLRVVDGDSLLVFDFAHSRITVYAPDADRPAYTTSLISAGMFPYSVDRIGRDRRLVGFYRATFMLGDGRRESHANLEVVRLLNPDGSLHRDSVLAVPERESLLLFSDGELTGVFADPFARETLIRVGSDGSLHHVWTDSTAVHVTRAGGGGRTVIRPDVRRTPRTIRPDEVEGHVQRLARSSTTEAQARQMLGRKQITTWPLLKDFRLDDRDRIWLAFTPATDSAEVEWEGFDRRGRPVGSFRLPPSATLHRIARERLYTVVTGDLDVPTVAVFRLTPRAEEADA